jgi:hypothetical protein
MVDFRYGPAAGGFGIVGITFSRRRRGVAAVSFFWWEEEEEDDFRGVQRQAERKIRNNAMLRGVQRAKREGEKNTVEQKKCRASLGCCSFKVANDIRA